MLHRLNHTTNRKNNHNDFLFQRYQKESNCSKDLSRTNSIHKKICNAFKQAY